MVGRDLGEELKRGNLGVCVGNPRVRLSWENAPGGESQGNTRDTQDKVIGRSRVKKDTLRYSHREIWRGQALRDGELLGDMDKGETARDGEP